MINGFANFLFKFANIFGNIIGQVRILAAVPVILDFQRAGVQYAPEASPGPHDSNYLFQSFNKLMDITLQRT